MQPKTTTPWGATPLGRLGRRASPRDTSQAVQNLERANLRVVVRTRDPDPDPLARAKPALPDAMNAWVCGVRAGPGAQRQGPQRPLQARYAPTTHHRWPDRTDRCSPAPGHRVVSGCGPDASPGAVPAVGVHALEGGGGGHGAAGRGRLARLAIAELGREGPRGAVRAAAEPSRGQAGTDAGGAEGAVAAGAGGQRLL